MSEDQVGYIKGRQLGDNCRKILDIFEFTEEIPDPGYVLFLDFEKAFDSVSREFMCKTLRAFNFGETFLKWIKILYKDPLCITTNNGHASKAFITSRGIRQGCPISSLLFVLVAEVMSISLRANRNIKGLTLNNITMTITQMADDTTLFLQDLDSVKQTLDMLHHFHQCAGLKLNKHKTEAFQLGVVSHSIDSKHGLTWGAKKVKVTGITVGKNMKMLTTSLVEEKVLKVRNLLNMWKARNLTIKGKITLLRSKVLPIFLYVATIVYVPDAIIKQISNLFFDFVWPSGKHHVKKSVLIQEIESGGLKMPDVASVLKSVKLGWLKRLCTKQSLYTLFASSVIGKNDIYSFMKYKCDVKYLDGVPNFYRQLFHFWYELHSRPPEGAEEILDEYLWYNRFLIIDNKPVFIKFWNESGIKRISDIIRIDGSLRTKQELSNEFGIQIDIMKYNSLISAIPSKWKKCIRESKLVSHTAPVDGEITLKFGNGNKNVLCIQCKDYYKEFVRIKYERPTALYKWEEMYYYADFDWPILFKIPYKVVRETDIHSLQYKIINRYIPCKVNLQLWGKSSSDKCRLCDEVDTIEHFFSQCTYNKFFWQDVSKLIQKAFDINIRLYDLDILFGIPFEEDMFIIINFCILYGKKYVYDCQINDETVSIDRFKTKLKNRLEVEIYIMDSNNLCLDVKKILLVELYDRLCS